jgi:hypothetical protein
MTTTILTILLFAASASSPPTLLGEYASPTACEQAKAQILNHITVGRMMGVLPTYIPAAYICVPTGKINKN